MIDHEHQYIFIHIPKTAGVSVYEALGRLDEQGHRTMDDYEADYFSFAFVRNPWDRLVSAYHYMLAGGRGQPGDLYAQKIVSAYVDFAEFATYLDVAARRLAEFPAKGNGRYIKGYPHLLPQTRWTHRNGEQIVDFIGRFESLQSDFDAICERMGRPQSSLGTVNASDRAAYRGYYDERTRQAVAAFYAVDIELLGYEF